jgi:hypothetical protein
LMLRPLFVTVGGGAGSGCPPTSPPLTPDPLLPSCALLPASFDVHLVEALRLSSSDLRAFEKL